MWTQERVCVLGNVYSCVMCLWPSVHGTCVWTHVCVPVTLCSCVDMYSCVCDCVSVCTCVWTYVRVCELGRAVSCVCCFSMLGPVQRPLHVVSGTSPGVTVLMASACLRLHGSQGPWGCGLKNCPSSMGVPVTKGVWLWGTAMWECAGVVVQVFVQPPRPSQPAQCISQDTPG